MRMRISSLFRFAVESEWIETAPTQYLPAPAKSQSRSRTFGAAEIATIWTSLEATRLATALVLQISLATGQRIGAVTAARASELDLDGTLAPDSDGKPVWRIPAAEGRKVKGAAAAARRRAAAAQAGRAEDEDQPAQVVPLSPLAVNLWRQALMWPTRRPDAEFVFPADHQRVRLGDTLPHVQSGTITGVWWRLKRAGKLPNGTAHDLRRTARTWWSGLPHGEGREAMERLLGHVIGSSVERTYDRALHLPPQRRVADAWGDKLTTIARGGAEFATIRKGAKESERV
jgi:integrase